MKTLSIIFGALLFSISMLAVSCNETAQDNTEEEMEEAREAIQTEKEQLKQDIGTLQNKVDRRISELQSQMQTASDDVKTDIQMQINKLEAESRQLDEELEDIGEATSDSWKEFKSDTKQMFNNVERELEKTFGEG